MQFFKSVFRHIFPLAVVVTLLCGVIYIIAQQGYRIPANDPQIQIAQDAAQALGDGAPVETVVPSAKVDIGQSLALFVVVYDDKGAPVAGNGLLHGKLPVLPAGVFEYTSRNDENRITWQPEPGVRHAIVIERIRDAKPGFVMVGRSLREVEQRVDQLGLMVGAGWAGTQVATFVILVLVELIFRDKR